MQAPAIDRNKHGHIQWYNSPLWQDLYRVVRIRSISLKKWFLTITLFDRGLGKFAVTGTDFTTFAVNSRPQISAVTSLAAVDLYQDHLLSANVGTWSWFRRWYFSSLSLAGIQTDFPSTSLCSMHFWMCSVSCFSNISDPIEKRDRTILSKTTHVRLFGRKKLRSFPYFQKWVKRRHHE